MKVGRFVEMYMHLTVSLTRYPIQMWSCHDRLTNGIMRTTNNAEIFHKNYAEGIAQGSHPGMPKFLKSLHTQQRLTRNDFTKLALADEKKEKASMKLKNERLQNALEDYRLRQGAGNFTTSTVVNTIALVLMITD